MPAGYSRKPLVEKLGCKNAASAMFVGAPHGYQETLGLPIRRSSNKCQSGAFDFIQLFVRSARELRPALARAKKSMAVKGMLWVSWPKRSSKLAANGLDESAVRDAGLAAGLVDIKICAVDDDWSGLKFVIPLKLRSRQLHNTTL